MIRKLAIVGALALGTVLPASAATQAEPNLTGSAVVLRALDKVTARTFDHTVPIGETLKFGSLSIHARHCEKTPPTELPEVYAFLQIDDKRLDAKAADAEPERIFSGWMFESRPAISALDHRVYDVWVIGCVTPEPKPLPETIPGLRGSQDYRPERL